MKRKSLSLKSLLFFLVLGFQAFGYASRSYSEPNYPGSESSWHELRQGFRLMDHYHDAAVTSEVRQFSQRYFDRLRKRILSHQAYLNTQVRGKNVPAELALLPLIESALNAEARSPANAVGFWQFMPDTAKAYGLAVSGQQDGRKDLVLATDAALRLLERLYDETGDWLLAIAAYNVGGGQTSQGGG